jgi:transcriptional regulator with XRE-family HTH domain
MMSFQIMISPSRRAAARFIERVRRELQKAFAEEKARTGLSQSEIARVLNVHRSVVNRELRGTKDLTLGRVAELAHAMGRKAVFALETAPERDRSNINIPPPLFSSEAHTSSAPVQLGRPEPRISSRAA